MKRITSLLALGFFSLGLATSASAQTKVTQLVIQNATGTTKLSQTSEGMTVDNYLILQRSGNANSTVKLTAPASNGTREFLFPESSGTLLTNATNTFTSTQTFPTTAAQGDALIASINGGSTKIDAARLNITLPSSGLTSIGSAAAPLNNLTFFTDGSGNATGQLNLAASNTWTGTQSFALNAAQGDALIASINAGTPGGLTGYATSSALSTLAGSVTANTTSLTTLSNSLTSLTNTVNALPTSGVTSGRTIGTTAPLAGGGDLSANRTLSLNMNGSLALDGSNNLGLNLANANTWSAVQTFPSGNSAAGIAQGNALITSINAGTTALTATLPSNVVLEADIAVTSPITRNVASGTVTLGMESSAAAGSYLNANVTVDAYGRVTAASNGGSGNGGGLMIGQTSSNMDKNGTNNYYFLAGATAGGETTVGFKKNYIRAPRSGVIKNLYVDLNVAPGAGGSGKSHSFTVRNVTQNTELALVTISNSSTSGNSGAATLSVNAGDILVMRHQSSTSPSPGDSEAVWSVEFQ